MSGGMQWTVYGAFGLLAVWAYRSGVDGWTAGGGFIIAIFIFSLAVTKMHEYRDRKAEQRRRQELIDEYGEEEGEAIYNGEIWRGMSAQQLEESLNPPLDRDVTVSGSTTRETWKYAQTGINRFDVRIRLHDGIVIGWTDRSEQLVVANFSADHTAVQVAADTTHADLQFDTLEAEFPDDVQSAAGWDDPKPDDPQHRNVAASPVASCKNAWALADGLSNVKVGATLKSDRLTLRTVDERSGSYAPGVYEFWLEHAVLIRCDLHDNNRADIIMQRGTQRLELRSVPRKFAHAVGKQIDVCKTQE